MANEKNLKPFNKRSVKERREISRKGGKASGEARRKKANIKKAFDAVLTNKVTSAELAEELKRQGLENTNETALAMIMTQLALEGNVRAFEQIIKLTSTNYKDEHDIAEQQARIKYIEAQTKDKENSIIKNAPTTDSIPIFIDNIDDTGGV